MLGLRTAIYPVSDLAAAKQWYAKVFNCEPYFDEPFYVGFEIGGFELGLIPDGTPSLDGVQVYWGVASAMTTWEWLLQHQALPIEPIHEVGGGILVGSVQDPFGNRLSIIENPHFQVSKVR
ncbi:MAG: hypothetical protein U0905_15375 [Pirellulales bacterium]